MGKAKRGVKRRKRPPVLTKCRDRTRCNAETRCRRDLGRGRLCDGGALPVEAPTPWAGIGARTADDISSPARARAPRSLWRPGVCGLSRERTAGRRQSARQSRHVDGFAQVVRARLHGFRGEMVRAPAAYSTSEPLFVTPSASHRSMLSSFSTASRFHAAAQDDDFKLALLLQEQEQALLYAVQHDRGVGCVGRIGRVRRATPGSLARRECSRLTPRPRGRARPEGGTRVPVVRPWCPRRRFCFATRRAAVTSLSFPVCTQECLRGGFPTASRARRGNHPRF